jgi:hypothetical protein
MIRTEDYSHVLGDESPGKWIALSEDESRIVGFGNTIREAVISAARNGVSEPVLIKMPSNWKFEGSRYVH